MSGLFLILFFLLGIVFGLLFFNSDSEPCGVLSILAFIAFVLYMTALPISRIHSKVNVEYIKQLQITIEHNREVNNDLSVLERIEIINEINESNWVISKWKMTGQKWYNNKWYFHPSTQTAEYIK